MLECGGALRDERDISYIRRYREHQQRIFYDPGTPTIKIAARRLENRSADADSGNDAVLSPGWRSFLCSRCSRDVVFVMSLRELASGGNIIQDSYSREAEATFPVMEYPDVPND
jgi:hypothetical protein